MEKTQIKDNNQKGGGKTLSGVVVSDKMKDTVVVKVVRFVKHSKYKKYFKVAKKYKAHNPGNTVHVGDKVQIKETRPISKDKHFIVIENSPPASNREASRAGKLKIEN
ncbi:MAG: 30S ribosomal protein S17 [Patescibacteria group bacterium]